MNTASVFFYISLILFLLAVAFHSLSLAIKHRSSLFSYLGILSSLLLFPAMLFAEARLSVLVLAVLFSLFLYTAERYVLFVRNSNKGKESEDDI